MEQREARSNVTKIVFHSCCESSDSSGSSVVGENDGNDNGFSLYEIKAKVLSPIFVTHPLEGGFPFWIIDHSVQALALEQGWCSWTGLRPWMTDRSQKSRGINEKSKCLLRQQMVLPQPTLPSWPCTHRCSGEALPFLNPDGKGDNAAISLIQDNPFHESGVHGMQQNLDAASKAVRPSLAKLFLIEGLTRKIYHLSNQQVLQHPLAVS